MRIPRFQVCECGHIGEQHAADGPCARCECERFQHPIMRHSSFAGDKQLPHYRAHPLAPPMKDSGPR